MLLCQGGALVRILSAVRLCDKAGKDTPVPKCFAMKATPGTVMEVEPMLLEGAAAFKAATLQRRSKQPRRPLPAPLPAASEVVQQTPQEQQ
jgi:hypothetical protein